MIVIYMLRVKYKANYILKQRCVCMYVCVFVCMHACVRACIHPCMASLSIGCIAIGSSVIESLPSFRCLRLFVESHGEVALDLNDKIVRVSKAFGALRKSVFQDSSLSRQANKMVYQVVVMSLLSYALRLGLHNGRIAGISPLLPEEHFENKQSTPVCPAAVHQQ